jgi:hypothetical protein
MAQETAEQVLANYTAKLGDELGPVLHHCRQQFWSITSLWDQFETLFGTKERVELMNASGRLFAYHVFWQFLNGVNLGITRLLDPPKSGKFENLTLLRLFELCPETLRETLAANVEVIQAKAERMRDLRNRAIAHTDLEHGLRRVEPLEYNSRTQVNEILRDILALLNEFDLALMGSETALLPLGNRDAFFHLIVLDRGQAAINDERRSREAGNISWERIYKVPEHLREQDAERGRYGLNFQSHGRGR